MQGDEHEGGGPPGPIEQPPPQQGRPQAQPQQSQHEAHQQQSHRQSMAHGQVNRQVVGMAVPMAGAERIDQAEGGGPPAQPGPFGHQPQGHLPLGQPGDGQRSVAGVMEIAEATPDRLGHQAAGGGLQQLRHPRHAGGGHHQQHGDQQGQQPSPGQGAHHQGQGQDQGSPGIAGIGEEDRRHQGNREQQHYRPPQTVETGLEQGRQQQRPGQHQPGAGDVGVIKQPGQATRRVTPRMEMPDHHAAQGLKRPLPTPPELAQAGEDDWHRGCHQHQGRPSPGSHGGQVGLKTPEAPEEGQPVAHAHPSQPAAVGNKTAQHHQGGDQQQEPVGGIGQGGATTPTAEQEGHEEEDAPQ